MCVIICKNKNGRIPTKKELENCFDGNPDGSGFAYVTSKEKLIEDIKKNKRKKIYQFYIENKKIINKLDKFVIIDKGYMKSTKFLARYEELCKLYDDFNNKGLLIHCRIGTAGSNEDINTHPYPTKIYNKSTNIFDNITTYDDLHNTTIMTDLAIVHNGIISNYNPTAIEKPLNISDTQKFICEYVSPLCVEFDGIYKNEYFLDNLRVQTNSKFAFLNINEDTYITDGFETTTEKDDGLYFSNSSYLDYTFKYYRTYNYDFDEFDGLDNYNYENNFSTQKDTLDEKDLEIYNASKDTEYYDFYKEKKDCILLDDNEKVEILSADYSATYVYKVATLKKHKDNKIYLNTNYESLFQYDSEGYFVNEIANAWLYED